MEFLEPTTETGQNLHSLLTTNLASESPKISINNLKRIFFMYGSKIRNQDSFISALYGQNVLRQRPLVFMKKFTSKVFGVQHGIELCLKTRKSSLLKELIVALEWSENDNVLDEIASRVEQAIAMNNLKDSCLSTENNSAILAKVRRITTQVAGEVENADDFIMTVAKVEPSSPPQAPAEAPREISDDDNGTPVPHAGSGPYQCIFKECQIQCWTKGQRNKHYKTCHDAQCRNCGKTDARVMISSKKCCKNPNIIGGPFFCLGHCEKIFDAKSKRRSHLSEVIRTCTKCHRLFPWRVQHRCKKRGSKVHH